MCIVYLDKITPICDICEDDDIYIHFHKETSTDTSGEIHGVYRHWSCVETKRFIQSLTLCATSMEFHIQKNNTCFSMFLLRVYVHRKCSYFPPRNTLLCTSFSILPSKRTFHASPDNTYKKKQKAFEKERKTAALLLLPSSVALYLLVSCAAAAAAAVAHISAAAL